MLKGQDVVEKLYCMPMFTDSYVWMHYWDTFQMYATRHPFQGLVAAG